MSALFVSYMGKPMSRLQQTTHGGRASPRVARLLPRLYPNPPRPRRKLQRALLNTLRPGMTALDAGCGRSGEGAFDARRTGAHIIGADVSEHVFDHPHLDERAHASLDDLPFDEDTFDVIYSAYVFEHLTNPIAVVAELARVLKPGGCIFVLTPNRWHYVPLLARIVPNRLHAAIVQRTQGRAEADTFDTVYRANSSRAFRRLAQHANLVAESIEAFGGPPTYLFWHTIPFLLGVAYERITNRFRWLSSFRPQLLVTLHKPFTQ